MKSLFKYLSKALFTFSLLILTSQFASALNVCPGQPASLIWSTNGTVTSCPTQSSVGTLGCGFDALPPTYSGNNQVTLSSGSCTVNFQCENGGGLSNVGSDTLNVVNGPSCCGQYSQSGLTVWNGSTCVAPVATPAAGTISANPNPCIIPVGASNCTSTISWSSTNNADPTLAVDRNYTSGLMSGAANGSTVVPWISYGGNIFEIRNGASVLASVTVRGVCTSGSVWGGSSCVMPVVPVASGKINASPNPCIIPLGAANCSSTVSWTSSNTTKPDVRVDYGPLMSGQANGTVAVPWISYGGNIFELRDNGTVIESVTVRGICASGSVWGGSICAAAVANIPTGSHDGISAGNTPVTFGWAIDDDEPNTAIGVHFYIDGPYGSGTFIGATTAGIYRSDGGIGNHGFEWPIPTEYCNGMTRNVYAYGINVGPTGYSTLLPSTPRSFNCNPVAEGSPTLSVTRSPTIGTPDSGYTVSWNSTNATTVSYSCSGGFSGSGSFPSGGYGVNGSVSGTFSASWLGETNCTWTATGPGGSVTKPDNFTVSNTVPTSCGNGATNPPTCNIFSVSPSGSISATACIIAIGSSGCNTSVSWSTQNLTGGATAVTYPNNITLSSLSNSSGISNNVSGHNVTRSYYLYHNGALLDSVSVISTCASGSNWNGSRCVAGTCANGATNYPTCNIFPPCANGLNSSYQPLCACSAVQEQLPGSNICTFKVNNSPVKISAFLVQPNQIACPGGNDEATLKFILNNTPGKTCRISAKEINATPVLQNKTEQIDTLNGNTQLKSNKYRSSNSSLSGYTKTFEQLIEDRNTTTGTSGGQIIMKAPKFTSGKRLFNYSTRFTMECGSLAEPIATRYVKTNVTYSSKSVDMLSICIGQD